MCENDILAMGAMDEIRGKFNLRIPDDIAVVGFDNYELGGSSAYSLTTYEQPRQEMIDVIIEMIRGEIDAETVTLPGKIGTSVFADGVFVRGNKRRFTHLKITDPMKY